VAQHRAKPATEKDQQIAKKVCHGIDPFCPSATGTVQPV